MYNRCVLCACSVLVNVTVAEGYRRTVLYHSAADVAKY